ncbi:MAG: IS110 family transposase [Bacteroidota bacterium]
MSDSKLIVGIDVSKDELDYVLCEDSLSWDELIGQAVEKCPNTTEAIESFVSAQAPGTKFVFEPTGTYSDKLFHVLASGSHCFSMVSPSKAHYFSQTMGVKQKTDQSAARLLAFMGAKIGLPVYQVDSQANQQRKQILVALNDAAKDEQAAANQLHALDQRAEPNAQVRACYESKQQEAQRRMEILTKELQRYQDPADEPVKKLVMSVKGVGGKTAQWLMAYTDSLRNFHDVRALLSYCGLAPRRHQSGSSVNRNGGITKQAKSKLRACLFMGAKTAIRYNLACKDLYQRLRNRGFPYHKAMVAVMAKLVKQIFGVVKSGIPFDNEYYLKFHNRKPKIT